MDADIDEGTAAGLLFAGEPAAPTGNAAAAHIARPAEVYFAQVAGCDILFEPLRFGTETGGHAHLEHQAGCVGRFDHLFSPVRLDGHRLFAQHVLACLQCGYGNLVVYVVGYGDNHRFDIIALKQFAIVQVCGLCAVFFLAALCPFGNDVAHGDGFYHAAHSARFQMAGTIAAATNLADS